MRHSGSKLGEKKELGENQERKKYSLSFEAQGACAV